MFGILKKKKNCTYVSKTKSDLKKKVIILMFQTKNSPKLNGIVLQLKKLSALH